VICRSCGGDRFGEVIDLGRMPLVNNLMRSADEIAPRWPLHVVFCRTCSLAQLTETPPPAAMFDEYLYFSSQSQTMVEHAQRIVNRFVKGGDRVLEIASNDGYLLQHAKATGATVLGVDPARNIADFANSRGIPTRCEYFNRETASAIRDEWEPAEVVFANNVLAHVPNPNEIASGIAVILAKDGIAHVEVPSLMKMIESCAFDTIYHEHHSYFSLTALRSLFNRHGLRIIGVELLDIHGGSFHLQIAHAGDESKAAGWIAREQAQGASQDRLYAGFANRVRLLERDLKVAMGQLRTVVGYGAAAKGIVLLNAFGLDLKHMAWVADVSPHKQGRFVPGTGQPIVSPQRLLDEQPDAALLLPWNIRDEVLRRNQAFRDQGGRFIVPIPEVEIV
jgi:hypothetical protein